MDQSSAVSGRGNVVVQIVGEHNAVSIEGARALRLVQYEAAAFAQAPIDPERKGEPGWTETGRREVRILYPYNRKSLPFQGRESLTAALKDWLKSTKPPVSVHALIGAGGRGKTRLAVEMAAWARKEGWTAGFVRRDDLDVFRAAGSRTEWDVPCLVVVDYAAAKSNEIAAWLRSQVHETAERPPLRLLLVERTGGEGIAWWRSVFGDASAEGEAVRGLLAPGRAGDPRGSADAR